MKIESRFFFTVPFCFLEGMYKFFHRQQFLWHKNVHDQIYKQNKVNGPNGNLVTRRKYVDEYVIHNL